VAVGTCGERHVPVGCGTGDDADRHGAGIRREESLVSEEESRFGLVGKLVAKPGERDRLADVLLRAAQAVAEAQGCRLYVVGVSDDPDAVWVVEVWDDREAHQASLRLESVRALIGEGVPLIAEMAEPVDIRLLGGHGVSDGPEAPSRGLGR
jgi:quinol monooxygenase YgiN